MPQIVPAGQFNPAALSADDLYISIVNPPSFIRGVATDVFGLVGTASWGPVNTPVHMGSAQDAANAFGPISAASVSDIHDIATDLAIAFGQSDSQASIEGWGVRVTDGTDTAAASTLTGQASSAATTVTVGGSITAADTLKITASGASVTGLPLTVQYSTQLGDTLSTAAAALAAAVNANTVLQGLGIFAVAVGAVVSIYQPTTQSPQVGFATSVTGSGSETLSVGSGSASVNGINLTALYTGLLGNALQAIITAGSQTNSFTLAIIGPAGTGALTEVYPNIAGGVGFWGRVQTAINQGLSGVRGPSQLVKAANANNAVGAPNVQTFTFAGGTDGRAGVTTGILLGSDAATPRTGLYALRNQTPPVSIVWIAGLTDNTVFASLLAFGQSEGCSTLAAFATGTSTAAAVAAVGANGLHDPSFAYVKDWIYFFDPINSIVRLVPPYAFIGGFWATLAPQQNPANKPVNLCLGTERLPPNMPGQPYSLSETGQLANAGVFFICNPIPAGQQFGTREAQTTSLNSATTPAEYWRMTMFLARSFAQSMGQFVDQLQSQQPNDPLRQAVKLQLNNFLQELAGLGIIDSYLVTCNFSTSPSAQPGLGMNTPASVAQHYLYVLVQVRYLSSVRFFVLSLQGGTTVVTVNGQGAGLATA